MAGDGNKAAYLCTPKNPGCPTYEVSLLQFWINRMIHTATQSRLQNYGPSPPIRAKHLISCSYNDLVHLNHHLLGEPMLIRTQQNLHRRLMDMVTVVC